MKFRIFNIKYAIEAEDLDLDQDNFDSVEDYHDAASIEIQKIEETLPSELHIDMDDDIGENDVYDELCSRISDKTGWLVRKFNFEKAGAIKYCVMIQRTGCLFVEAESPEQAMYIANHQLTDTVNWSDDWEATGVEEDDDALPNEYVTEPAF